MAIPPQLLHVLENIKYQVKDAFWALSSCICQESAKVKINGRTCAFSCSLAFVLLGLALFTLCSNAVFADTEL